MNNLNGAQQAMYFPLIALGRQAAKQEGSEPSQKGFISPPLPSSACTVDPKGVGVLWQKRVAIKMKQITSSLSAEEDLQLGRKLGDVRD